MTKPKSPQRPAAPAPSSTVQPATVHYAPHNPKIRFVIPPQETIKKGG